MPEEEALTNDHIVEMVQGDIPPNVVVDKIWGSIRKLDTSPSALVALRKAGVQDTVLEAIVQSATADAHNDELSA